ncbi:MAG: hypothetical protein JWP12_1747 [Bacteroidetes bacterium]|nr:hypothetical protein [Bacteroidota bacterium]
MKRNKASFFMFLLFISVSSFAQSTRETAQSQIVELKTGVLLVRLKTSENYINTLLRQGDKKGAEEARLQQEKENKEIVAAFRDNFTFCKVYFFYSRYSDKIKAGKVKGYIMNANFEKDTLYNGTDYLIGDFGESETTKLQGFIMKNKNSEQLKSPFPFLIKLNRNGVIERSKPEIVQALNKELFSFYTHVTGK